MPECLQILGNDLYLNLLVGAILAVLGLPFPVIAGMVIENSFDILRGKNHRIDKVLGKYVVALDCVHEAERHLPGPGRGMERFPVALTLYQERMGKKSVEEDTLIVQMMFDKSSLSR